jgi:cytochrome o ubiquinol oxidase subunit 2
MNVRIGTTASLGLATLLGGCAEPGVLDPAGPVAAAERVIMLNSLAIMLAIVLPVIVLTLVFAWWFRAGNSKATYRPDWSYSGRLELLVWSIPALVVVFLGGIAWIGSHELAPERPLRSAQPPVRVEAIALDWKWLFVYPDYGIASVNRLVMPVGRPVAFRVTSATVMNSLMVPRLGGQIYAMSGMVGRLHYQADRAGRYEGLSAHYSGEGFADMRFAADAVAPADFDRWVAGARASGPALDDPAWRRLEKQSLDVRPYTYARVRPGLFDAAVASAGGDIAESASGGRER